MLVSDSGKQERAPSAHTRVEFIQSRLGVDKGFVQRLLRRYRNRNISEKRFSAKGAERTRCTSGRAGDAFQPCRGCGTPRGPGVRVGIRLPRSGGVPAPAAGYWWSAASIHCHVHALEGSSFYYGELERAARVHSFSSFSKACSRAQSGTQQP